MKEQSTNSRLTVAIFFALAVLAIAPYAGTIGHQFVNYDDNLYVTQNYNVRQGFTLKNISWAMTTVDPDYWHPLTWYSHMLDIELWGLRPGGHHLTSLILHAADTMLLFWVLFRLTGVRWRSAVVAALFAVHPLHVESVAWVAERKDVLSTFFGLLAILVYAGYVRHRSVTRYLMIVLMFTLSLMAKPMLVTLPFILLLLDVWPLKAISLVNLASQKKVISRLLLEKIPLLALSAGTSLITIIGQKAIGAMLAVEALPLKARITNALVAYASYLTNTVWPVHLAVVYPLPQQQPAAPVIVSAVVLLAITAWVVYMTVKNRMQPYLLVGWLWFLGTLVPVIGLVQVGGQSMADRYTYVPLIGIFIMAAWWLPSTQHLGAIGRKALAGGTAVILGVLAIMTWLQARHWKDTVALFSHAVEVTDENYIAHNLLGDALREAGQLQEAFTHIAEAIRIHPNYAAAHSNLGSVYLSAGQLDKSLEEFTRSLDLKPTDGMARSNRGAALLRLGRLDDAVADLRKSIELWPNQIEAHVNLGGALAQQGKPDQAIEEFTIALSMQPNLPEARANLGQLYLNQRRIDDAVRQFTLALQARPDMLNARVSLGVALAAQGKLTLAITEFETVLRTQPNHALARSYLEATRRQLNQSIGASP